MTRRFAWSALLLLALGTLGVGAPAPAPAAAAPAPAPAQAAAVPEQQQPAGLTMEEVAKHSTEQDCWFVYQGSVYDVTQYMAENLHPVGNGYITPWCGKDCTDAFDSDHGRHLGQALADLEYYLLGPLAA